VLEDELIDCVFAEANILLPLKVEILQMMTRTDSAHFAGADIERDFRIQHDARHQNAARYQLIN
jgi:hypothetical protein